MNNEIEDLFQEIKTKIKNIEDENERDNLINDMINEIDLTLDKEGINIKKMEKTLDENSRNKKCETNEESEQLLSSYNSYDDKDKEFIDI